VFNQFDEVYEVTELAEKVKQVGQRFGVTVHITHVENPRREQEEHHYHPDHEQLFTLGYRPTHDLETELAIMVSDLMKYKGRIEACQDVLIPDIRWDGTRRPTAFLPSAPDRKAKRTTRLVPAEAI
jgi:UDP-sulfoquinovose synthase